MKRILMVGIAGLVLMVAAVPRADASAFMSISINGGAAVFSCNNSVAACAGPFTSAIGSSTILFGGGTVGAYTIGSITLLSNAPGSPTIAQVLDSKTSVSKTGGLLTDDLVIDFGVSDFTLPTSPLSLSSSATANWAVSSSGDSHALIAWGRDDNALSTIGPGLSAPAISPTLVVGAGACVSGGGGGTTIACGSASPDVAFAETPPYSLVGRETIHMTGGPIGGNTPVGSYTGAITAIPTPEPNSIMLIGTGLAMLAGLGLRRRK